ncbi:MAG: hypothetical protein H7333_04430 [Bdellovibrionales bacterium]|nr:hypothetical protein [Oligoflexia bacterium]
MKILIALFLALTSSAHADSWNSTNDPSNLSEAYNYTFDRMPLSGGVASDHMPWSDNYWESDWGGISLRWNTLTVAQRDPDLFEYRAVDRQALFQYVPPSLAQLKTMSREALINLSPAEKYDILMSRYDYPTVQSERERTDPGMHDWQGICHGWVPAAINHVEPLPVDVTNSDGMVIPFGSTDVKGLFSYYYGVTAYDYARGERKVARSGSLFQVLDQIDLFDPSTWVSLTPGAVVFNGNGGQISPDSLNDSAACADPAIWAQYGSVEKCKIAFSISGNVPDLNGVGQVGARGSKSDPNAGAFHVVMTNQLGLMHRAFAANLNRFGKATEIWNQPVTSYESRVDYDNGNRRGRRVGITTTLTFVTESPQSFEAVVGTPLQRFEKMVFSYELEIDSSGQIVGGNWRGGKHPGFLWKHDPIAIKGYFTKLNEIYHPH